MDPVNGALGGGGDPVDQDRGVPLHQEQREAGDCVAANLALIPPSLSCHCLGNFLQAVPWRDCSFVNSSLLQWIDDCDIQCTPPSTRQLYWARQNTLPKYFFLVVSY